MTDRPTPQQVIEARCSRGLTQSQAAALVHSTLRSWQHWERGTRNMPLAHWELFKIKARSE